MSKTNHLLVRYLGIRRFQILLVTCVLSIPVFAKEPYSPHVRQNYPSNIYWGDTHLHSNLSHDANGMGNKDLTPDDAYRFAKGETIIASNGQKVRLSRPLDFLVVADHAHSMGVMLALAVSDKLLLKSEAGKRWHKKWLATTPLNIRKLLNAPTDERLSNMKKSISEGGIQGFFWKASADDPVMDEDFRWSIWKQVVTAAEHHNRPGKFTSFSGYEWTPNVPAALHRVVIFKDAADKVTQVLPFSRFDSPRVDRLWDYLSDYEEKTGGEVLSIPHNSNLSNGFMFALKDDNGRQLSTEYAKVRSRWEPLLEITQIKGDSETHPVLSPSDEFSDYETWNGWGGPAGGAEEEGWKQRKQHEYARSALKLGLGQQATLGVNPFKFGVIGSTDSHTSLATADEDNFWGKFSLDEPSKYRLNKSEKEDGGLGQIGWGYAASGYAAIWAEENTREALFAAMKRKEVYASTGPRMTVRFFGGWDYQSEDAFKPDLAQIGYAKGVPMGGDLTNAPKNKAPSFLIRAVKDPDGANLDRVQVIKGWHDKQGELHEKIYNVALSDGRQENWRGKIKPVGNTVNIADASYTNSIGDPELAVVWKDPDFDKDELAFYYVRVLEIPTPRWTAYDAEFFGMADISKEIPMVTQERAYTSPIWYGPSDEPINQK